MKSIKRIDCAGSLGLAFLFVLFVLAMNGLYHAASDDCTYGLFHTFREALYQNWVVDGYRPVVHTFAYIFCGCFDKWVFNLVNTAVMVCFVWLMYVASAGKTLSFCRMAFLLSMILFVLCKGESYLWMAGSVNYLWTGTGMLVFYLMRSRVEAGDLDNKRFLLFLPFAVLIGWSQESFALPVAFAICVSCLFGWRTLNWRKTLFYGAFGVGVVLLLLSTVGRASELRSFSLQAFFLKLMMTTFAVKAVWLLCVVWLLSCRKRDFLKRNCFELLVIVGSVAMISIVGFHGERSVWCANMFAILLLTRELEIPRALAYVLFGFAGLIMVACVCLGVKMSNNWYNMLALCRESKHRATYQDRVETYGLGRFFHQVVYDWQDGLHGRSFGRFYGLAGYPFVYRKVMYDNFYLKDEICKPENRIPGAIDFYTTPQINTLIHPLGANEEIDVRTARVKVRYAYPKGIASLIMREIRKRNPPPVSESEKMVIADTPHGRYLLASKETGSDPFIVRVDVIFPDLDLLGQGRN